METMIKVLGKAFMGLLVISVVMVAFLPQAESFELTITNNYDQESLFSILYHEDSTNKWLCKGWYSVPAATTKDFNFNSSSPFYAYIYSSVCDGEGEEDAILRMVVNDKFQYYDGENCPMGMNRRQVTFSKFTMNESGAHIILGDKAASQAPIQTEPQRQMGGITKDELYGIELLNNDRAKYGLVPLIPDEKLTEVARGHATDMVANNYFDHTNLQGESPYDRMAAKGIKYQSAGENIAYNYSLDNMEEEWMNSPGHRANILNAGYTHVGLGLYPGEDGSIYGVQLFASY